MECPECCTEIPITVAPERPFSASLIDAVLSSDVDEQLTVSRDCEACGWREERTIHLETIEVTEGDSHAIERATLVDEFAHEVSAIENIATLEAALAAIRRQPTLEDGRPALLADETSQR